ncbi:MAG: phospholipase [Armatimonadaceae bacterium]
METRKLSLTHLVRQPLETSGEKPPVLFLLHGVGSNERDLFGLTPYLDKRFLIISVRARLTLGPDAFGWYPVQFTPTGVVADEGPAEESRQVLVRFVEEAIAAYGADPKRVFIAGFSQGAAMSIYAALTRPELFAGVVPMSGRLLPGAVQHRAANEALQHLAFLVVHGTRDTVLPISQGREIRATLEELPVSLEYHEYGMGHEVSPQSLATVTEWLTAKLDGEEM